MDTFSKSVSKSKIRRSCPRCNRIISTHANGNLYSHRCNTEFKEIPKNQIFLIENFIDNELCNEIIKITDEFAINESKLDDENNVRCKFIPVKQISNVEIKDKYDKIIFDYIHKFVFSLRNDYGIHVNGDSGYCLRKIHGPTRFHTDGLQTEATTDKMFIPINKLRNMSVIIALNDDYEGGELHFINQNFRIKLKKGQLIAFPPYWTHFHGTEELRNNTYRYTINTWLYE